MAFGDVPVAFADPIGVTLPVAGSKAYAEMVFEPLVSYQGSPPFATYKNLPMLSNTTELGRLPVVYTWLDASHQWRRESLFLVYAYGPVVRDGAGPPLAKFETHRAGQVIVAVGNCRHAQRS